MSFMICNKSLWVIFSPTKVISISENGLYVPLTLEPYKMTFSICGLCAKTCPNHIIHLINDTSRVVVKCSSHDKGAQVRKACTNGCIGCMKCQKTCPHGAITVKNNLAVIDYDKCTGCGECQAACPVKCIHLGNFICGAHFE